MNRRGIILFYLLTYTFAWGLSALFLFFPAWMVAHFGSVTLWNPIIFATIWTPTIFAFVLALALDGAAGWRDLFSRVFRWRIKWRWYLVSTLGTASLALGARFVHAYMNHSALPHLFDFASWPSLTWYGVKMLVVDPGPIGEDPGWRGYALPRMLQRFNPTVASVLLGAVWAVWHLPAFLFSGMPQSTLSLGWFLLAITSLTVLMSWVAINTGGAVIPAVLMHWAFNRFAALEGTAAMYEAIAFSVAVLIVVAATRGRLGLGREKGNAAEFQTSLGDWSTGRYAFRRAT